MTALPQVRRLRLPSGTTLQALHWACAAPVAPAALLVHGLGDTGWVWQGIAPMLARDRDVVAVDLRGHGGSDHLPAHAYSVADMAADVLALADLMSLEQPWLVGHSLGAAVSLCAAGAAPTRFSALAVVDYAAEVPERQLKLVHAVLRSMDSCYPGVDAYAALLRRRHPLACAQLLDAVAAGALRPAEDGGHRPRFDPAVLAALCNHDSLDRTGEPLARLQLPVLVVRGALSSMVSMDGAHQLVKSCAGARLAVVPMAGHSVQIDNPQGLLKVLREQLVPEPA